MNAVEPDLLKSLCGPALLAARNAVAQLGLPSSLQIALGTLIDSSGLVAIASMWRAIGAAEARWQDRAVRRVVAGVCTALAVALALWIGTHPSERFDGLFARWDHLAFAGAAGFALTALGGSYRHGWLAAIGLAVLLQYAGVVALTLVLALSAAGILVLRTPLREHRGPLVAVEALLVVAAYGAAFALRGWSFELAGRVQALLTFWMLRHISLIVAAAQSNVPSPAACGAFLAFYPGLTGLFGAPEVFSEFARRNLARPPVIQHQRAGRRLIEGVLLLVASMAVPASIEQIEAATNPVQAWAYAIVYFIRTALAVMGAWRTIDGTALLYGVQLRMNFAGLLTCRNPSELWWAWRGTLTNWLVQFVYVPLGANRRHQSLNIAAAFVVSFLWHALGGPFVVREFRWAYLAPVAIWATVNALAVIAHVNFTRWTAGRSVGIGPPRFRTAVATGLTWALASLTPILLFHHGAATARAWNVLAALSGWR